MAYVAITTAEIAVGEPTTNTTFTKVKDNLINHETRIVSLEGGGSVVYPPLEFRVNGYYGYQGAATGWVKYIPNFALTLTGARLYIDQAGTAGTTEIDIMVKSGVGAYTSIFTTKPSLAFGAGNDSVSSNGILDPTKVNILAGDIIRLDTTSVQTLGHSFIVKLDYIKT